MSKIRITLQLGLQLVKFKKSLLLKFFRFGVKQRYIFSFTSSISETELTLLNEQKYWENILTCLCNRYTQYNNNFNF